MTHLGLGAYWQDQRQLEKAQLSFRQAHGLDPENPLAAPLWRCPGEVKAI